MRRDVILRRLIRIKRCGEAVMIRRNRIRLGRRLRLRLAVAAAERSNVAYTRAHADYECEYVVAATCNRRRRRRYCSRLGSRNGRAARCTRSYTPATKAEILVAGYDTARVPTVLLDVIVVQTHSVYWFVAVVLLVRLLLAAKCCVLLYD